MVVESGVDSVDLIVEENRRCKFWPPSGTDSVDLVVERSRHCGSDLVEWRRAACRNLRVDSEQQNQSGLV